MRPIENPPTRTGELLLVGFIVFVVAIALVLGYLVAFLLRIPVRLGLPLPIMALGLAILFVAVLLMAWFFRFRRFGNVLTSTYVSVRKLVKGIPLEKPSGRVEPLVVSGPYRFIRHPLYFNVVLIFIGWWLVLDYTFILLGDAFLFLWFYFFLEEFEEKELKMLYGEAYEKYRRKVPKMVPFSKIKRT